MGKHIFKSQNKTLLLWGGNLWTSGFYANTVGQFANEEVIKKYIQNQGKDVEYTKLHEGQLNLEL